jgi:hypothetical protein
MLTKICTICSVDKSVGDYYKKKSGKYGVVAYCKCCAAEQMKEYRKSNREKIAAYRKANKEDIAAYNSTYRKANRDALLKYLSTHAKSNRHLYNANNAKYKAAKLQATPAWANKEHIDSIYLIASINREGGFDLHVDHIVPLQSDIVCGLHCEANLQLLPASYNISKGNRHWPDMP